MKQIAIITDEKSDFSACLEQSGASFRYITFAEAKNTDLDAFDAFCILAGTSSEGRVLDAKTRTALEEQIKLGKRVFIEFCQSIGNVYSNTPQTTRFWRLVSAGGIAGDAGSILDAQCNDFQSPFFKYPESEPILYYKKHILAHSHTELTEEEKSGFSRWALWKLNENVTICGFRIANFTRARFSPVKQWQSLISELIAWICGTEKTKLEFPTAYTQVQAIESQFDTQLENAVTKALKWFEKADMLVEDGRFGVKEGLGHDIFADCRQARANTIRDDCCGEVSLAYYFDYLLQDNEKSLERFYHLQEFIFTYFQIRGGLFNGMMRWTETAWGVCYQDDVARAIIPALLYTFISKDSRYQESLERALFFLVKTTGQDGLRVFRTDNVNIPDEASLKALGEKETGFASAHYNAYYHAALLLGYKISGKIEFLNCAVKGLESIMKVFPDTVREQSETEENCRLVFPLSILFWVTKNEKHRAMLELVVDELQNVRRGNAYIEWDTGYKANCSQKIDTECSLLTQNGDPVVDLLYSNNWLPLGFAMAYLATGEEKYKTLWQDTAIFMIEAQIHSHNPEIDGCFTRCFDIEKQEVYGVPHDVGWGPWAVETGWTVGEITAGLEFGMLFDRLKEYF